MSRKGLRRLDLWLPYNHPVFGYPAGVRAQVARDWLDLGMRLSGIERRLAELEEALGNCAERGAERGAGRPGFDAASFARVLRDAFD